MTETNIPSSDERGFLRFALRYAYRSIGRNKRRTVITIGTVALSVMVSLIGTRYASAILKLWQEGSINHGSAHAQFHVDGYWDQPDVLKKELMFEENNPIETKLDVDKQVDTYSRRLKFEGIISSRNKTIYFLGMAIEPSKELKVSPGLFDDESDKGEFISDDDEEGIVVGKGLAESLDLKIGDDASLMINTIDGSVNAVDVRVIGITDLPLPSLSKRLVYMHLNKGRDALELGREYTELAVRLVPETNEEIWVKVKSALASTYKMNVKGWWQIDPVIKDVERLTDSLIGVICVLLFVSAGISVLNIVFMLVAERTVEIGTLMAIGAKAIDIQKLFTIEASMIGAFGGILGVTLGNAAILIMNVLGVPFDSPFGSGTLYVHPNISWVATIVIGFSAVVICFLSALAPARKASQVEPVVAFRGQMT